MVETPVAFFIWQRPSLTAKVFARLREMRPKTLIIVADGPKAGDIESEIRCERSRAVVEAVDWPCEVIRCYAACNMGLQDRIESGLDFVFDRVDRAIILEDDCLPDRSFFPYVEDMLDRYADDERVGCIGGDKPAGVRVDSGYSYGFTRYTMIWGWATWRRVWRKHDRSLSLWPAARATGFLERVFRSKGAVDFWSTWFDRQFHRDMRTWDVGLTFSCLINGMHSVVPATNLVANLGFGPDATHTLQADDARANQRVAPLTFPLQHPPLVCFSQSIDAAIERTVFSLDPHAFSASNRGLPFQRIRHGFGHHVDGRADLSATEKLALLQRAILCGAGDFHLLSEDNCRAFADRLLERGVPSLLAEMPPPSDRSISANTAPQPDVCETVSYRWGFDPEEGPYPEAAIGKLRWMTEPRGVIELLSLLGGEYRLMIIIGNLALDQHVDIVVDGRCAGGFDITTTTWDPLSRLILPIQLLPGDTTISIEAVNHVQEPMARALYLAIFGVTLIRADGERESRPMQLLHGKKVVDTKPTLGAGSSHAAEIRRA